MPDLTNRIEHVTSPLERQTLLDGELTRPVAGRRSVRILPWLQVVKIGGRSVMDRGYERFSRSWTSSGRGGRGWGGRHRPKPGREKAQLLGEANADLAKLKGAPRSGSRG